MMLKEFALFIAFALVPAVYGATRTIGSDCPATTCSGAEVACLGSGQKKCACNDGFYNDGTSADCVAEIQLDSTCDNTIQDTNQCAGTAICDTNNKCKKALGTKCTESPAGQCAAGSTCTATYCKAALGAKCTAENAPNNCVETGVCRKQDTATNLKCTAVNTLYAACTVTNEKDPCTDNTKCTSTICKCKEDYEAKVGDNGVSTCVESGAGFIQGSVLTVVLTAMAAVWARG